MIKTRFAPSPTGFLHLGSLRTALYAYLFARQSKGHLILRIEDTDQTRFVEGAVESLLRTLNWAGLHYDEGPDPQDPSKSIGPNGPYTQSQRTALYEREIQKLLSTGHAYRCFCTLERLDQMRKDQQAKKLAPMYDKKCRYRAKEEIDQLLEQNIPHVIRLAVPENEILRFRDGIRGDLEFASNTIDDQVLMKSDGYPTYHLANVVDDHHMEITHVIRAEEWLPSTPKHIYLYRAFDWKMPEFAHLPLILNKDKTKLSKRQNDVAVEDYIAKGYLPEAMVNFVALLGWNPGGGETNEIFSMDELIEKFRLEKVHKAGAVFDVERLNWMNGEYIHKLPLEAFKKHLYTYWEKQGSEKHEVILETPYGEKILKSIQPRIKTLSEARDQLSYFILEDEELAAWTPKNLLENAKMNVDAAMVQKALEAAAEDLEKQDDFSSEEAIKTCLMETIHRLGLKNGQLLWPLRVALTGKEFSPGVFEMIYLLGKQKSLKRIKATLIAIQSSSL